MNDLPYDTLIEIDARASAMDGMICMIVPKSEIKRMISEIRNHRNHPPQYVYKVVSGNINPNVLYASPKYRRTSAVMRRRTGDADWETIVRFFGVDHRRDAEEHRRRLEEQ